jgi:fido (protein-threonine AMPylation protein)
VAISGAKYRPPDHLEVPRLMQELVDRLKSPSAEITGFTIGVYAHWAMARIHPFVDGNGRMARIVQDLLFLRHRLVPAPVSFKDVDEYYAALEAADEGKPAPFVEFIARATLSSLAKYHAAIQDVQRTDDWIEDLATSVNQSIRDADHALYLRWSQKMAEVRETFSQVADKLTSKIAALTCKVKSYGELDYQQFREIREHGSSSKTWDFGITFKLGDHLVRFIFWYGCHFPRHGETDPLLQTPVLLVSIDDGGRYELLEKAGQTNIALREIGVREGEFVQVRYDPVEDRRYFDSPMAASQICQDFVTQVLRGKLRVG